MTTTKSSLYGHDVAGGLRSRDVQIDENVNFTSLLLPESILKGLHSTGFKRPSPIQLAAIPLGRCGLDMIVQAKSGTGKTLVFTVIALELLDMNVKRTQVIIVAPTREIAVQIADVIETVGQHVQGLKVGTLIGGTRVETSRAQLRKYQIIVGAPGRIRHLIENSVFDSKAVRLFVLDEADKLMEDTFVKDVNYIFHSLAESKQIMACSATYTPDLVDFVKKYMKDGLHITPNGGFCPVLLGLRQFVYLTGDHINPFTRLVRKQQALFRLISTVRFDQCLIFCNYVVRAESLCGILQKQGWGVTSLTSKQTQEDRLKALTDLKENKARILVTTDLAARGIDASAVNLVINMDVPISPEVYLHRIGRAGRFGNKGLCVTIVSKGEDQTNFQRLIGKIPACEMSVSVIPEEETADLWQEGEYEVLKGIEPVENNDLVEEEGEQDNDEKIDSVVEAKILPALVEDESIVGKSIEESMATEVEDGEIVEDDDVNGDDKKRQSADESSSSGVDLSSPSSKTGSPPSGGDPPKYVDWKNHYDVDHVVDHLSNLSLRHSTSPWRLGHENLWRGNGPQSCFPFQSHRRLYHNYRYHGYYYPQEYYDEPTSRYDASRRNPNTWSRNNYWMHALTSQIDNYVHYARRFHS